MRISDWSSDVCSSDLVPRIVLAALQVRLHIRRRHQPGVVAEPRQLPAPIVRRPASLHPDQRRRLLRKELHDLIPTQLPANHHIASRIDPVNLDNALRKIDPKPDSLSHGRPPSVGCYTRSEEHTSELQSLMSISYAVFFLKKKTNT